MILAHDIIVVNEQDVMYKALNLNLHISADKNDGNWLWYGDMTILGSPAIISIVVEKIETINNKVKLIVREIANRDCYVTVDYLKKRVPKGVTHKFHSVNTEKINHDNIHEIGNVDFIDGEATGDIEFSKCEINYEKLKGLIKID